MPHPSSTRELSTSIMLAILIVAFGVVAFTQLRAPLAQAKKDLMASTTNIENLQTKAAALEEVKTVVQTLSQTSDAKKIEAMVPITPNIPSILANLETLAKRKGLILNSVVINPQITKGKLVTIAMNVEFAGTIDYTLWKSLLTSLETNLRLIELASAQFNPTKPTLSLSLTAFSLTPSSTISGVSIPTRLLQNEKFKKLQTQDVTNPVSVAPGKTSPFVHPPVPDVPL